jgi:hypothetical protein
VGESHGVLVDLSAFRNIPVDGATTYVTTGFSNLSHVLNPKRRQPAHLELLFAAHDPADSVIVELAAAVAESITVSGNMPLRGDALYLGKPIVAGSVLDAVYFAIPVYHPEGLSEFNDGERTIVIAWVVPISENEMAYVAHKGWPAFEELLETSDPDLMDLQRPQLVTSHPV